MNEEEQFSQIGLFKNFAEKRPKKRETFFQFLTLK